MITLFNIWHYIFLAIAFFIIIGGIVVANTNENIKQKPQIIASSFVLSILFAGISIFIIDKYTKEVKVYRLEKQRNLNTEKIMYSGIVRNEGAYEIGKVTIEIRIINQMQGLRSLKHEDFFKSGSFLDSLSNFGKSNIRPSEVTQEFIIAKNLKPKESREFRVYLDYPPYFNGFSDSFYLYAH